MGEPRVRLRARRDCVEWTVRRLASRVVEACEGGTLYGVVGSIVVLTPFVLPVIRVDNTRDVERLPEHL